MPRYVQLSCFYDASLDFLLERGSEADLRKARALELSKTKILHWFSMLTAIAVLDRNRLV